MVESSCTYTCYLAWCGRFREWSRVKAGESGWQTTASYQWCCWTQFEMFGFRPFDSYVHVYESTLVQELRNEEQYLADFANGEL